MGGDEEYKSGYEEGKNASFLDSFMQGINDLDKGSSHDKGFWDGTDHKDYSGEAEAFTRGVNESLDNLVDGFFSGFGGSGKSEGSSSSGIGESSSRSSGGGDYGGGGYSGCSETKEVSRQGAFGCLGVLILGGFMLFSTIFDNSGIFSSVCSMSFSVA